jgi:hypothetical protein
MSMLTRICLGTLGALLSFGAVLMLLDGSFSSSGRYGWLMPFLGVAFFVYALGGSKLLRKYFPSLAEKEDTEIMDDEKSKK